MVSGRDVSQRARRAVESAAAPFALTAFAMALLASWGLSGISLDADELATDGAAGLPFPDLLKLVGNVDLVVAPYYVVMHVWTGLLGHSHTMLRLPSALAMVLAAGLTADMGRRLWGQRAGFVAGATFVLIPSVSRYAQEARPYAGSVAAVALAAWLVIRTRDRPTLLRDDILSAAAFGLAGLLQPVAILAAPGLLLLRVAGSGSRVTWLRPAALYLLGCCLPVAMLVIGLRSQSDVWDWITLVTWDQASARVTTVLGPAGAAGAVLLLATAGVRADRTGLALGVWGLAPIAGLLVAGSVTPLFVGRLLMFTTPALALLAASAFIRLGRTGTVLTLVSLGLLGASYQVGIRGEAGHTQDSIAIRRIIEPRFQPGDVAVYGDLPRSIRWAPRDIVRYYLPPSRTPADALAIHPQRYDGQFLATLCTDLPRCLGEPERVWVIRVDTPRDPLARLPGGLTDYLRDRYRVSETFRYPSLTVALLTRDSAGS